MCTTQILIFLAIIATATLIPYLIGLVANKFIGQPIVFRIWDNWIIGMGVICAIFAGTALLYLICAIIVILWKYCGTFC